MKLMICRECGDVVLMRLEERSCVCGKSRGRYLEDRSTVEQTAGTLSIALDNRGLHEAVAVFDQAPDLWHPLMMFRAFLNPLCETDVRYAGSAAAAVEQVEHRPDREDEDDDHAPAVASEAA
jgi:hypothetical protein